MSESKKHPQDDKPKPKPTDPGQKGSDDNPPPQPPKP